MGDGIRSLISMAPVPKKLLTHRLGRTMLLTPHLDWTAEQVVAAYSGQQRIERVFRGLKDGDCPVGDRCILGPIARLVFTLSIGSCNPNKVFLNNNSPRSSVWTSSRDLKT